MQICSSTSFYSSGGLYTTPADIIIMISKQHHVIMYTYVHMLPNQAPEPESSYGTCMHL
jgi:hypothetical protein